jgi:hypothetical protein
MTRATLLGLILGSAVAGAVQAQSATVSGPHANEAFCKTLIEQVELFAKVAKLDPFNPDMAKRAQYFKDAKVLNATLVKTAPASLSGDVAFQAKNANAMLDAQLAKNVKEIRASAAVLRSPESLAAARHINDYCGAKLTVTP